ncbi:MAG: hypothetical protein LQ338_006214 [Usnochroma carphineum]|nr:MAG: hypothetical protein LQ338_006214 [Usnochroma carphineum]
MLPRELIHDNIALSTKPSASIHYTFAKGKESGNNPPRLVVFLNGLMTDKTTWLPVMAGIIRKQGDAGFPSLLAYDRYGQGLTEDRDPQDQGREEGRGHNIADVVRDLYQLITQISKDKLDTSPEQLPLVFVANSIGCAIARLYAEWYSGSVGALLLLDSMMANSNFDWWPDPESSDFDPKELPEDVTVELLRKERAKFAAMFAPDVINKEGLDRRNLAELLPHSDEPLLPPLSGPGGGRPLVTVVEHDPERFATESLNGLLKITDSELATGPIVAKSCGHFIQRDDPNFVVDQLYALLTRLEL